MKKILLFFIIIFMFFINPLFVFAENKIDIKNVAVLEKSSSITMDELSYSDNNISSNITFNQLNDFITLGIEVENNTNSKMILSEINNNFNNNYLKVESQNIGKSINNNSSDVIIVKIKYEKELINHSDINLNNASLNFVFEKESILVNPLTSSGVLMIVFVSIFIVLLAYLSLKNKKKYLMLLVLLIPLSVYAADNITANLLFNDITIKGRNLQYRIQIDSGVGPTQNITREYGNSIGELPNVPDKDGYNSQGWVNQNKETVTTETIVTEDLIITPKYKAIDYHITYDLDGGIVNKNNKDTYTIEDEFTLTNPTKDGYSFRGWSSDGGVTFQTSYTISRGTTGDINLVAYFSPNEDTKYTVIHRQMNLNGEYVETEREELFGTTDSEITPQVKNYTGFKKPELQTKTILGDESTVFIYDYERNKYTLNIADRNYLDSTSTTNGEYYFDTEIKLKANSRAGYDFEWSDGNTNLERTFKISNDTNLTPIYIARNDTTYKVIHKQMNLDGKTYSIRDEFTYTGTTDTQVTPPVIDYNGFDSPNTQTVNIDGDGSRIVIYLYERQSRQLTIEDSQYVETNTPSGSYLYDTEITLTAKERDGYTFVKWSNDSTNRVLSFNLVNNTTIRPIYSENDYHITFVYNGGNVTEEVRLIHPGNSIGNLPVTEKNGYYFDGWYTDLNWLEKVNSNYVPSGSMELIARWKKSVESMEFENTSISLDVDEEKNINITNKLDIEEGYSFTSNDEEVATVNSNGKITGIGIGETTITIEGLITHKTKTINVVVLSNEYAVTFNGNGGLPDEQIKVVRKGHSIGEFPTVTRNLYYFDGWYLNLDSSKINGNYIPNSDIVLYAKWKKTIENAEVDNSITLIEDDEQAIQISNLNNVEEDYTFTSNNTSIATVDSNGKVRGISSGDTTITIRGGSSNKTITINVTVNERIYTITFNGNEGEPNEQTKEVKKGNKIGELPSVEKTGYYFDGWYTSLNSEEKITSDYTPNSSMELIAKWKKSVESMEFEDTSISLDVEEEKSINITNKLEIEEGYTFTSNDEGVALVNSNGKITGVGIGQTTITIEGLVTHKTKTINIVVLSNEYAITFNGNGGEPDVQIIGVRKGHNIGEFPTVTRNLYYLDGWYSSLDSSIKLDESYTPNSDTVLYAKWKKSIENATANSITVVEDSNQIIQISNLNNVEEEYSFTSNDKSIAMVDSNGKVSGISPGETTITIKGVSSNKTITISVTVNERILSIKFEGNGGEPDEQIVEVRKGHAIDNIPDVERVGYYLDGWYTSLDNGEKITNSYNFYDDIIVYAKWKKSVESMEFEDTSISLDVEEEKNINITNKLTIEEGYTFTSNDEEIAHVDSNGKITGIGIGQTTITIEGLVTHKTKTINVVVLSNEYAVTFNGNGGLPDEQIIGVRKGHNIGEFPTVSRDLYYLDGWYSSLDSSIKLDESYTPNSDTVLYAKWKKSIENASVEDVNVDEEDEVTIQISNLNNVEEDYTFTSNDESIAMVDSNGKVSGIAPGGTTITIRGLSSNKTITVNVTVIEIEKTFTVKFNANGGDGEMDDQTIVINSDVHDPLHKNTFTRLDYNFVGWNTESNGTGNSYYDEEVLLNIPRDSVITLYAMWSEIPKVIVTYNANGGSVSPTFNRYDYDSTYGELPIPEKDNNTFLGWKRNNLPDDYQQVEYIASSKAQYIDTGFVPNQDTTIETEVEILSMTTSGVFGSRLSGTNVDGFSFVINMEKGGGRFDYNGQSSSYTQYEANKKYILKQDKNKYYVNGELIGEHNYLPLTTTFNEYIFAMNTAGSLDSPSAIKLYHFKIWDNGVLVRDYVPCYKIIDNTIGLYDLVSDSFYINQGTGTFIKGNDVNKYITSDTPLPNNIDHSIYADWQYNPEITFDAQGGEVEYSKKRIVDQSTYGELPVPEKDGYTFREWSAIPDNYQQLNYIESSGSQYINSNYVPNNNTKVEVKYNTTANLTTHQFLYGARLADFNDRFSFMNSTTTANNIRFDYYDNIVSVTATNGNVHTVIQDKNQFYVDGAYKGSNNFGTFISPVNMYIFAVNTAGTAQYMSYSRIYYMKIWDNNELVRYFVPVLNKNTSELGLYDVVGDRFYSNQGDGNFTRGVYSYEDGIDSESHLITGNDHTIFAKYDKNPTVSFDEQGGSGQYQDMQVHVDSDYGDLPTPDKSNNSFIGWSLLPDEYQQVEYIESTGTQYIDTGVKPNDKTGFEIDFMPLNDFNSTVYSFFGVREAEPSGYVNNVLEMGTWTGVDPGGYMFFGNHVQSSLSRNAGKMQKNIRQTVSLKRRIHDKPNGDRILVNTDPFTTTHTLLLFARYKVSKIDAYSKMKLYSFKLYDEDTVIRNYIPCYKKSNHEVGLYDIANDVFYTNKGTGYFNAGLEVNQYISNNTHVISSSDHTLYAEWGVNPIVSFDANGGEVDTESKQLLYNSQYGDLPEPTKDNSQFLGWSYSKLPDKYKEVDYIQFDGGEYIDTGIVPSNHKTEIKFEFGDPGDEYLFGTNGNAKYYQFRSTGNTYSWGTNGTTIVGGTLSNGIHTLIYNGVDYSVIMDNTLLGKGTNIASTSNLTLGRFQTVNKFYGKVYYMKITNKGTGELVRNFVPCVRKEDGTVGLYDLVSNNFYGKMGTKRLTAGNEKYITSENTVLNENHTLYAAWDTDIKVTLDTNGATTPSYSYNTVFNATYDELPELEKDGYDFLGWSSIDEEYQQVEYIESHGNEYILTDVVPTNSTGVHAVISDYNNNSTDNVYLGVKGSSSSAKFYINNNYGNTLYYWNSSYNLNKSIVIGEKNIYEMNYYNSRDNVINNTIKSNITANLNSLGSVKLALFAANWNGTINYKSKIKLYELKFTNGDEIIADYVPCYRRSDGAIGLYDRVNNVFSVNQGDGDFGKGSSIYINNDDKLVENNDHTLYAIFGKFINVSFDSNGGSEVNDTKTVVRDEEYGELPITSSDSNKFVGWSLNQNDKSTTRYKQVEYIESTGTEYIDTGFVPNGNTTVEAEFAVTGNNPEGTIYSAKKSESANMFATHITTDKRLKFTYNSSANKYYSINLNQKYKLKQDKNAIYIDDELYDQYTYNNFAGTTNMFIFASHRGSTIEKYGKLKLYSFKLYDNGTIIRNYIPCVREEDNVPGLYDTVNKKFYINKGTGVFKRGNRTIVDENTIVSQDEDHTLYGTWQPYGVHITYDMNGGSLSSAHGTNVSNSGSLITYQGEVYESFIPYGRQINDLMDYNNEGFANIVKTGYDIRNITGVWNTEPDGSGRSYNQDVAYNSSDFCEAASQDCNITLYVNWKVKEYDIIFNANGGTGTMNNQHMTYFDNQNLYANEFTREGYEFVEWSTKADGFGTQYQDEQTVQSLVSEMDGSITLYAIWKPINYITYDFNTVNDMRSWMMQYKNTFNIDYNSLTKMNSISMTGVSGFEMAYVGVATQKGKYYSFEFDYKNNTTILNDSTHGPGIPIQVLTTVGDNDNKSNQINVSYMDTDISEDYKHIRIDFKAIGATTYLAFNFGYVQDSKPFQMDLGNIKLNQYEAVGSKVNPIASLTLQNGYTFNGYFDQFTEPLTTNVVMTNSNLLYYGEQTANGYYLKFNANGGTGEMDNQFIIYDTSENISANLFTKDNYYFAGWNTQADGFGTSYSNEQTVKNLTTNNNQIINLYAQWRSNNTFTYDFNEINDMNIWQYNKKETFNSVVYDEETQLNTIDISTKSGSYEIIYVPITTIRGQYYTFEFDYINPQTMASSSYAGVGVQALKKVDNNYNTGNQIAISYINKEQNNNITHETLTFKAVDTTTYLAFNFSMLSDGKKYNVSIGNMKLVADLNVNSEFGDIVIPTLADGYILDGYYTDKTGGDKLTAATIFPANDIVYYARYMNQYNTDISEGMGYVGDGLMLHFDGIMNYTDSHYNSSIYWDNLVKNRSRGVLKNGPVWGENYLQFDGSNDWVSIGQMNYSNITLEAVVEYTKIQTGGIIANEESGGYGLWSNSSKKNMFEVYISGSYKNIPSSTASVTGHKYKLTGSYDGSTVVFWEDNDKYTLSQTGTIGNPSGSTYLILGANPNGASATASYAAMKLYSIRVYNRALTDEEVEQNYNVDKVRFGLE